ncbi:hypothetical protein OH76DRAFT_651157 [Lentinus brumalis]|uniref:Uncharacterized protein n=1 Tax=Lentinus brumalis TaxID=2498619 RepID=A0A371D842_9APHY|nr:hypothetical protein OH76DRAFT_651157 [Polyporus brumalis]
MTSQKVEEETSCWPLPHRRHSSECEPCLARSALVSSMSVPPPCRDSSPVGKDSDEGKSLESDAALSRMIAISPIRVSLDLFRPSTIPVRFGILCSLDRHLDDAHSISFNAACFRRGSCKSVLHRIEVSCREIVLARVVSGVASWKLSKSSAETAG